MKPKRINQIDIMKGIGAILVLVGHLVNFNSNVKILIYSFHMPLFFLISGYTFHYKKDVKKFIKSKIKTLIIPYISITILSFIVCYFVEHISFTFKGFMKNIIFYNSVNQYNSSLWFLIVLFESVIIFEFFCLLKKKFNSNYIFDILYTLLLILLIYLQQRFCVVLPFGLSIVPHSLLMVYIGHILNNRKILNKINFTNNCLYILLVPLIVIGYSLALYNGKISMSVNAYNNYILYFITALLNTFIILIISGKIKKDKLLEKYCEMSLFMFSTQRLLFKLYNIIQNKIGIVLIGSTNYLVVLLVTVITMFIYYAIYGALKRLKIKLEVTI